MAFRFKDCIDKGLLRKIPASSEKASMSIKKAENWSSESKKSISGKALDASVIASYMVMFHAARAVLFHDGYREKSHACVARYLEEKYVKTGKLEAKWVELLDHTREIRHNNQYDLSFCSTEKEAQKAITASDDFLERIIILLNSL
ncbi:HEPN domain-containing protein [Elusimicrobiota bacterium]